MHFIFCCLTYVLLGFKGSGIRLSRIHPYLGYHDVISNTLLDPADAHLFKFFHRILQNPSKYNFVCQDSFALGIILALASRQTNISGKFIFHRPYPFLIIANVFSCYKRLIFAFELRQELPDYLTA